MLKPEIEKALNDQVNQELGAAHDYLAMASYFRQNTLGGFASFMLRQSQEERDHAMKFFNYIDERGGTVALSGVAAPTFSFSSPREVFEAAYEREKQNTRSIHAIYKLAQQQDDPATQTMLHWFIDEQVEEEAWCEEALALLEMVGDNPSALLMLDKKYGAAE